MSIRSGVPCERVKSAKAPAEPVRGAEKIRDAIGLYNRLFESLDGWQQTNEGRPVFKFRLQLADEIGLELQPAAVRSEVEQDRVIPRAVKVEVWQRDKGGCALCGPRENLHFDHIIPYSQGGSSKAAANIQILCAKHNLEKKDNMQ